MRLYSQILCGTVLYPEPLFSALILATLPCLAMGKAFDLLDRSAAWWAVARLAGDASLEFFLKLLHRGVCYILKDRHTGHQLNRILTSKGVCQGSVEGPACFLALHDTATWEVKSAGDREAVLAFPRGPEPVVKVSRTLASLQQFIASVSAIVTTHNFQVNVVTRPGSRSLAKTPPAWLSCCPPARRSRYPARAHFA